MEIVEGERVNPRTLFSLGFKKTYEGQSHSIWSRGQIKVIMSAAKRQLPKIMRIIGGHLFYYRNSKPFSMGVDKFKEKELLRYAKILRN